MEAVERTISQILTEEIRYEVSAYQRPYLWEKGNVGQLLEDIWEAFFDQEEWDADSIAARQAEMVDTAEAIWGIA